MKNREIKFRAWNGKQMIYPSQLGHGHVTSGYIINYYGTAMQFTGLTDKNGKEIYEGDIRRNINHYEGKGNTRPYYNYHKIVWDDKLGAWAAIHLNNTDESLTINGNCFLYVYLKNSDSEHVGNIHENECDTCNGQGSFEVYRDDSEIVKGDAACPQCDGTGFVIEEE